MSKDLSREAAARVKPKARLCEPWVSHTLHQWAAKRRQRSMRADRIPQFERSWAA